MQNGLSQRQIKKARHLRGKQDYGGFGRSSGFLPGEENLLSFHNDYCRKTERRWVIAGKRCASLPSFALLVMVAKLHVHVQCTVRSLVRWILKCGYSQHV